MRWIDSIPVSRLGGTIDADPCAAMAGHLNEGGGECQKGTARAGLCVAFLVEWCIRDERSRKLVKRPRVPDPGQIPVEKIYGVRRFERSLRFTVEPRRGGFEASLLEEENFGLLSPQELRY